MLRPLRIFLATFAMLALAPASRAAHDFETAALADSRFELVVLEAEGCIYCQIFRRDVLPAYEISQRAREVPLRFVDLNETQSEKLALSEPVDLVPTVVLLKDHKEVGRIAGYVGPEAFFHSVSRMLAEAE